MPGLRRPCASKAHLIRCCWLRSISENISPIRSRFSIPTPCSPVRTPPALWTGLALLARRCQAVWIVERADGEPDRLALLLSAILASVLLGPILDPARGELFGVKTARAKLEG